MLCLFGKLKGIHEAMFQPFFLHVLFFSIVNLLAVFVVEDFFSN